MSTDPTEARLKRRLAANIRAERARRDWSQDQLAEHAGFGSPKAVSRIETCESEPGFTKVVKLAWALGVPVETLFAGMEQPER